MNSPQMLRRSPEPVLELGHNALDFPLGAFPRISVFGFEQDNQVVASTVDAIDIVGAEFCPLMVDFISKVLPSVPENVLLHLLSASSSIYLPAHESVFLSCVPASSCNTSAAFRMVLRLKLHTVCRWQRRNTVAHRQTIEH